VNNTNLMRRIVLLLVMIPLLLSCAGNNNRKNKMPPPPWEEMEKGWTHMGTIATYSLESDGRIHCCSDCARLDYQVVNGATRYRIFYPLESSYIVFENPEYGTNSRFRDYKYKAGHYYLNL